MTTQLTLFSKVDDTARMTERTLPTSAEPTKVGRADKGTLRIGDVFTYNGRDYELLEVRAPLFAGEDGSLIAYDRESFLHMRRVFYDIARFEELSGYTVAMEEAT